MKTCYECGALFKPNSNQLRCHPCRMAIEQICQRAMQSVGSAVRKGLLPNLRTDETRCVDCGARATCYDHRDYLDRLAVDPVCRDCNRKRGPSAPVLRRVAA